MFPFGIAEAAAPLVSERYDLSGSTMADASSRALWELTGLGPDDIAHVDLYSCFPSAVQVQAGALGFGLDRPLTVTGGMRFSGGPWNNYAMHGLATMVGVLRGDPGALGLCSANGGYLSKLSLGVYSATPPEEPFQVVSAQAEVDAGPHRAVDDAPDGWGTIESYTVMHDRAGDATEGILACLMPDGRRAWGIVADDADVLREMTTEDMIGRDATLRPDGRAELD